MRALAQAEAELALHRVAEEVRELHEERLVEAEVGAQLRAICSGVASCPSMNDHRVADVLEQHEGDERHREHDEHGLDQAAQDEGEHRVG